ncbi:Serine/threonine-protein phosphatase 7 long form homolog [Linum perenne]
MSCLAVTPDPELIMTLVERWRPETNTIHLYRGEATITLEDVHFLTGLSVDDWLFESSMHISTNGPTLATYVERLLGRKLEISELSSVRVNSVVKILILILKFYSFTISLVSSDLDSTQNLWVVKSSKISIKILESYKTNVFLVFYDFTFYGKLLVCTTTYKSEQRQLN